MRAALLAAGVSLAVLVAGASCSDAPGSSCDSTADCGDNQRCLAGKCTANPPVEDAGAPFDAGAARDAGADAGPLDAGPIEDAGAPDAGPPDAGYCLTDAGDPPNLLFNAGFECGVPPDGWVAIGDAQIAAVSALAWEGAQAARVTSQNGGTMSLFPTTPPVTGGAGIKTYCASSWVNGIPGRDVRISIQAYPVGGGALMDTNTATPLSGGWERIGVSAKTTAFDEQVTMRVWMPAAQKDEQLYVDSAQLWVSPDGNCDER